MTNKTPAHYEEDHLVSLELGGHPRDPRNLWPERWGTPAHPLTHHGAFPSHLVVVAAIDRMFDKMVAKPKTFPNIGLDRLPQVIAQLACLVRNLRMGGRRVSSTRSARAPCSA